MWLIMLFPGVVFGYCSKTLTVDISDGVLSDSVISKYNVKFGKNNYYSENGMIFGCICQLKNCVRKCCAENESLIETKCSSLYNRNINYKFYNGKVLDTSNETNDVFFLHNDFCQSSSYVKIMLDGKFYLQSNGSLYDVDIASEDQQNYKMYSMEEYCLENVLYHKENEVTIWKLEAFLCVEVAQEVTQVEQRNSIGNFLQVFFFVKKYSFPMLAFFFGGDKT